MNLPQTSTNGRYFQLADLMIAFALAAATFAFFAPAGRFDFMGFDDPGYVQENPHVRGGLSWQTLRWALTTREQSNWHPLTWLSHALDVSLFGARPGPMHLVNAALHAFSAALLFLALFQLSGARWCSAWIAGMFAVHPLHVESVAWISERKDVLSTLFAVLCLLSYTRYARRPSSAGYALTITLLAAGLMCKPMLVTLPALLLLLDFWPLRRTAPMSANPVHRWAAGAMNARVALVVEKLPMLLIAAASALATFAVQAAGRSVATVQSMSLVGRVANAVSASVKYLELTLAPRNLAIFYPHPATYPGGHLSTARLAGSIAILLSVSLTAWVYRQRWPWLLVGWCWYLISLLPVIGLVQVGRQALADRYTYLPLIGIFIAIAFSAECWARGGRTAPVGCEDTNLDDENHYRGGRVAFAGATALVCLLAAAFLSHRQLNYWRNTETMMTHAIAAVPDNYAAHAMLGRALDDAGASQAAEAEYRRALAIDPNEPDALYNLAVLEEKRGHDVEAERLYRQEIGADRGYAAGYNNLGNLLAAQGRTQEAERVYRDGLREADPLPQLDHNLAISLAGRGELNAAIVLWRQALALKPDYAEARFRLGQALLLKERSAANGLRELQQAVELEPNRAEYLIQLAWSLATNPESSLAQAASAPALADRAATLAGEDRGTRAHALDIQAIALARAGRFADAAPLADQAVAAARSARLDRFAQEVYRREMLYRDHKPFTTRQLN